MISFDCWAIVALWTSKCALWCLAKNWQDVPCRNEPPLAQQQPTSIKRQLPFTVNIIYIYIERERELQKCDEDQTSSLAYRQEVVLWSGPWPCLFCTSFLLSSILFGCVIIKAHSSQFGGWAGFKVGHLWSSMVIYGHLWSTELRTETWWKSQMLHLFF